MRKVNGCIEVSPQVTEDEFLDKFIDFVESNGWSFGEGIEEIQDDYDVLPDGR